MEQFGRCKECINLNLFRIGKYLDLSLWTTPYKIVSISATCRRKFVHFESQFVDDDCVKNLKSARKCAKQPFEMILRNAKRFIFREI